MTDLSLIVKDTFNDGVVAILTFCSRAANLLKGSTKPHIKLVMMKGHVEEEGRAEGPAIEIQRCPCCMNATASGQINRRAKLYGIGAIDAALYECNVAMEISQLLTKMCNTNMILVSEKERETWLTHAIWAAYIHQILSDLIGYDGLAQLIIAFRSLLISWTGWDGVSASASKHDAQKATRSPYFTQIKMVIAVCVSIANKCVDDYELDIRDNIEKLFEIDRETFFASELSTMYILARHTPFALSSQLLECVMEEMGYAAAAKAVDVS